MFAWISIPEEFEDYLRFLAAGSQEYREGHISVFASDFLNGMDPQ